MPHLRCGKGNWVKMPHLRFGKGNWGNMPHLWGGARCPTYSVVKETGVICLTYGVLQYVPTINDIGFPNPNGWKLDNLAHF